MRSVLLVLTLAGCGRLNFDETGPEPSGDPYRDLIVADGPIAYWRLGETAGTTAVDEMGRIDGLYVGDCERGVPGALTNNSAVRFNPGTPLCMVTFDANFDFPDRLPYTIEAWIEPTSAFPFGHIFSRQVRDSLMPLEGYAILESPTGLYAERIVNSDNQATSDVAIPADTFTHVAVVYDGDALTVYIDGIAGTPKPDTTQATSFTATAMIGCSIFEVACFQGVIDDVAIYGRALSTATIAAHHAARSP